MKFLTLEKEIFGLDISDRSLKIVNLKKKKNSFVLSSFNQIEIEPGIIENGVIKNENALVKIIKSLLKSIKGGKIKTKYVAASLPEEKSFLQVIQMPGMEEEELKSAVVFEAENYIPLPMSEVYFDFEAVNPVKGHSNHVDVLIAATPKKIVNSYVSCLRGAGLIPAILEVESQAIARALIKNYASTHPIILIDFGKTSTAFIVFAGHSIRFTCSIPFSSEQLTQAIAKSLGISLEKAEKIKSKYDVSGTKTDARSKKIFEAVDPILEGLVAQIKKYSDFYQSHASHEHLSSDYDIEKALICGGGASLKGLPSFLSKKLGLPVELGSFWIDFPSKKAVGGISKESLSFTTALGLALRGIEHAE